MKTLLKLGEMLQYLPTQVKDAINHVAKDSGQKTDDLELHRHGHSEKAAVNGLDPRSRCALKYVSARTQDRDDEIVIPEVIQLGPFRKYMHVLFNHNYSLPPIGSDRTIEADEFGIKALTEYADTGVGTMANVMWALVSQGHQKASSIGFVPTSFTKPGARDWDHVANQLQSNWKEFDKSRAEKSISRIITGGVLLEHSDVTVPCNVDAEMVQVIKALHVEDKVLKQFGWEMKDGIIVNKAAVADPVPCTCDECGFVADAVVGARCPECKTGAMKAKGKEKAIVVISKGGPGSGNFGHEGRPGEVGGSGSGGGAGKDKNPSESTVYNRLVNEAGGTLGNLLDVPAHRTGESFESFESRLLDWEAAGKPKDSNGGSGKPASSSSIYTRLVNEAGGTLGNLLDVPADFRGESIEHFERRLRAWEDAGKPKEGSFWTQQWKPDKSGKSFHSPASTKENPHMPGGSFSACVLLMEDKGHDSESAKKICGALQADAGGKGLTQAETKAVREVTGKALPLPCTCDECGAEAECAPGSACQEPDCDGTMVADKRKKGGPGSGNYGHEGRPGEVGGSGPGGGGVSPASDLEGVRIVGSDQGAERVDQIFSRMMDDGYSPKFSGAFGERHGPIGNSTFTQEWTKGNEKVTVTTRLVRDQREKEKDVFTFTVNHETSKSFSPEIKVVRPAPSVKVLFVPPSGAEIAQRVGEAVEKALSRRTGRIL
jgi:phage head maturation protease